MSEQIEGLYQEALSALKAKDYHRASDLFRQILLIDENYKDTSRLLAQTVKLRRRRWYNDPRLWVSILGISVVALLLWLVPKISPPAALPPTITASASPTTTLAPIKTEIPTETSTPASTPIPLVWKRLWLGQELVRDTIIAFIIDPKDPDVLYAGMENAGVYKSIDGGLSWRPALYGLTDVHVESLLVDGQDTQNVYAGTPSGIFKTEDGGENWSRIGEGHHVLIDPQNNLHLYARDADSIYESTDQGESWKLVYSIPAGCPGKILSWTIDSWTIHPTDGNTLYLGGGDECERGIYQSDDSGRTWTLIQKVENPAWFEIAPEIGTREGFVPLDWLAVRLEDGNFRVDYGPVWETRDSAGSSIPVAGNPFCHSCANPDQMAKRP